MRSSIVLAAFFAVSASALSTHHIRHNHARHAMNVRAAKPVPVPEPVPVAEPLAEASAAKRRTRRANGQCRKRPTSAAPSSTAMPAAAAPAVPVNVAPAPASHPETSSKKAAPAPSPKPAPAAAPKPASNPAPAAPQGGARPFGDFFAGVNTGGDGTYYAPGLGACGFTNSDTDLIVAVPFGLWGSVPGFTSSNPNDNPICGKEIIVWYQNSPKVRAKIVDECMGCTIPTSLDMSPTLFQMLAPIAVGRIHDINWEFASN